MSYGIFSMLYKDNQAILGNIACKSETFSYAHLVVLNVSSQ